MHSKQSHAPANPGSMLSLCSTSPLVALALAALEATALGQNSPTFFVSPGGAPTGDLAWEAAVQNVFFEQNCDSFVSLPIVTNFVAGTFAGPVTVNIGLEKGNEAGSGSIAGAERFPSTFGFTQDNGTVWSNSLLNRNGTVYSRMTFTFSRPVDGFGAWLFDDWNAPDQYFTLLVVDSQGNQHLSPALSRSGQTGGSDGVEGYLGVTSPIGIVRAAFISRRTDNNSEVSSFFEVDNLHIGRVTNRPPVAHAGPDQSVAEGALVTLDATASFDPDSPVLGYTWTQLGATTVLLDTTDQRRPRFLAPEVTINGETLAFLLQVTDGEKNATDLVNVTVTNVNRPPVADAGSGQTVQEGAPVTLDASDSYDTDGDALGYSWSQTDGPQVALSGANSPMLTFTAPQVGTAGAELVFEVTVSDGWAQSTDVVSIQVSNNNQPPLADAGGDQTRDEGAQVGLDGSASNDPDGDVLIYFWEQLAGSPVTLSDPGAVSPSFLAPLVNAGGESLLFRLTASDGLLESYDLVAVHIQNLNDPPLCSAARPSTAILWPPDHKLVAVDILGLTDPNSDSLTVTVTGVTQDEPVNGLGDGDTGPDAMIVGGQLFLRAERFGPGNGRVYHIQFTADDGEGGLCGGTVTVAVPPSRKSGVTAIDSGLAFDSTVP